MQLESGSRLRLEHSRFADGGGSEVSEEGGKGASKVFKLSTWRGRGGGALGQQGEGHAEGRREVGPRGVWWGPRPRAPSELGRAFGANAGLEEASWGGGGVGGEWGRGWE